MAQTVKNPPAMKETWVQSPVCVWGGGGGGGGRVGRDALEKEIAPYSSILAWKIPWTEEPGALVSLGSQRAEHD